MELSWGSCLGLFRFVERNHGDIWSGGVVYHGNIRVIGSFVGVSFVQAIIAGIVCLGAFCPGIGPRGALSEGFLSCWMSLLCWSLF